MREAPQDLAVPLGLIGIGAASGREAIELVRTTELDVLVMDLSMPGQSGGPVFRYNEAAKKIVFAGVHTTGFESENRARRYDALMQKNIAAWIGGAGSKAIA